MEQLLGDLRPLSTFLTYTERAEGFSCSSINSLSMTGRMVLSAAFATL